MRCLLCEAEMVLVNVVEDQTMMVAGFEHHTYMCSSCSEIERRFIFNQHPAERDNAAPIHAAPPLASAPTRQDQHAAAQGFWRRVLAKVRSA